MIDKECKKEINEFLKKYPMPQIRTASTIYNGEVVCIHPVKTIFGPELMCSPKTKPELIKLLTQNRLTTTGDRSCI